MVLPTLACILGVNEAIILQQIHYWLENVAKNQSRYPEKNRRNFQDGRWWTYQSIPEWHRTTFQFWSESTIKRTFLRLESMGLLITRQLARDRWDRTNWYAIDYERLNQLYAEYLTAHPNEPCSGSDCTEGTDQLEPISLGQDDPMLNETPMMNQNKRGAAPPSSSEETELDELRRALNEVTGMDSMLNRSLITKSAGSLAQAGYNAGMVRSAFGKGGAWYSQDWRGKKGEVPTVKNVIENIAVLSRQSQSASNEAELDQKRDQVRQEIQAARKKRASDEISLSKIGGTV